MPEATQALSKIAIGTAQFGLPYGIANTSGRVNPGDARAILEMAAKHGINTLDTAISYGDSESALGEIGVENWRVITKLSGLSADCSDVCGWVSREVAGSLSRLKSDRLHGLLLHRPSQLLEGKGEALYQALCDVRSQGLVQKIGVSIYEPSECSLLKRGMKFDLLQAPFNVIDSRFGTPDWLAAPQRSGCELHVRSVFLQGLLLMEPSVRPRYFDRWSTLFRRWDAWLRETGLSALQVCLRYALSAPGIERVVLGVESPRQLQQILEAADGGLPEIPNDLKSSDPDLLNPSRWALA